MSARAEQTRQAILAAAAQLFSEKGYAAVTMRQIAKQAGCSHTTIYIYFKDKESLLQELATEPLEHLGQQLTAIVEDETKTPDERLHQFTETFIAFGLANGNLYNAFFMAEAEQVDVSEPERELNRLRNQLFGLLRRAIQACVAASEEQNLAFARIYFYMVHGIISTYAEAADPAAVLARLNDTFALGPKLLLTGFREGAKR